MSKAGKMGNKSSKGVAGKRYLKDTDTKCVRILFVTNGKKRFVWGVEQNGGGYRHVAFSDTEVR